MPPASLMARAVMTCAYGRGRRGCWPCPCCAPCWGGCCPAGGLVAGGWVGGWALPTPGSALATALPTSTRRTNDVGMRSPLALSRMRTRDIRLPRHERWPRTRPADRCLTGIDPTRIRVTPVDRALTDSDQGTAAPGAAPATAPAGA